MAVHIVANLCFVSVHRDVMFAAHCRMRGIIAQLISCFWRKRISRRMNRLRALRSCAWMSTTKNNTRLMAIFQDNPGQLVREFHQSGLYSYLYCSSTGVFMVYISPAYLLTELQSVKDMPSRQRLRSWSSGILAIPTSRLSTVGDRAFPVIASRVWNALPVDVISSTTLPAFKRLLKTELFSRSFPDDTAPAAHDYSVSATFVVTS